MILHLTKKLAGKLKLTPPTADTADGLLSWRANYIQELGQQFVVFMNDESRFAIVLNDAKAARLKNLQELFFETLRATLRALGVNPDVIDSYITELGNIAYAKNSNAKKTAQLNRNTETVWWALDRVTSDLELSLYANSIIFNVSGADEVIVPREKMLELLSRYGLPVRKFQAFDINVRLDLNGDKDAVRKLRVPTYMTFKQLHRVLQTAFNWRDCHLYNFKIFKQWSEDYFARPEAELVMIEEDLEDNPDARLMAGVSLSEYLPKYRKILYTYDYGDNWHHYIELENVIEDCDEDLPILLSGEGDSPPEDVGGTGGYADFLEILADPSHEDYNHLTAWAKSQKWKPFDFKQTASRVKSRF